MGTLTDIAVTNTCDVHISSPPRLITNIDIADRAIRQNLTGQKTSGALVSIDLSCSTDIFYGYDHTTAKFYLTFQDQNRQSIRIQNSEVGYFRLDKNFESLVNDSKLPSLRITGPFQHGATEINIQHPDESSHDESSNVRIVALLDAYPSSMEVSISLSTLPTADRIKRLGVADPYKASSPDEERLKELLHWTARLGYEKLFAAYLEQIPSGLAAEDEFGMTPFSWAAFTGKVSVVQLALHHAGCSIARRRTIYGHAPLEAAARSKDEKIFNSFLKLLKYFEELGDESELGEIPPFNEMPALDVEDIERELNTAAVGEQTESIKTLLKMILARKKKMSEKKDWLSRRMLLAAEKGALCLVRALTNEEISLKAGEESGDKVDTKAGLDGDTEAEPRIDSEVVTTDHAAIDAVTNDGDNAEMTPLLKAIHHNKTKVAEFLIIHGPAGKEPLRAALCLAVKLKRHKIIRTLLQVGTLVDEELKKQLMKVASDKRDSTTLMLLKRQRFTGKLATFDTLDPEVDELFEATVVDFSAEGDPVFQELSVADLMKKQEVFFELGSGNRFKWFHLPANNMKWAEALIGKIYGDDPSSVYDVLEPKRWVKRQHEGERDSAHARFMMPACHDFSEAFKNKKSNRLGKHQKDKDVVLFMPYLHWDEEETMKKRSKFIANYQDPRTRQEPISKEEKLLTKYLLSDDDEDPHSRHVLHIRRTLDQSVYHNLKDTNFRDLDQAVQRYQKDQDGPTRDEKIKVIMVDQLWLWILVGQTGKAETVITCFPSRDWTDVGTEIPGQTEDRILDQRRTTDVLQITKSYIQHRPTAVKTAYDLAGVIASRCSRALLDHSADMLNFAEVYENSISYVMNEEASLFDRFNKLMQTRTRVMKGLKEKTHMEDNKGNEQRSNPNNCEVQKSDLNRSLASIIAEDIEWLEDVKKLPTNSLNHCLEYHKYTLETEIPNKDEIEKLKRRTVERKIGKITCDDDVEKKKYLTSLLEKFGRFYVLDITREITLLRQIKDIQDELEMMEKIFADQQDVLEALDRIIRMMLQPNFIPDGDAQTERFVKKSSSRRSSNSTSISYTSDSHGFNGRYYGRAKTNTFPEASDSDNDSAIGDDDSSQIIKSQASFSTGRQEQNGFRNQTRSMIWEFRHQKHNLPLRTVFRHSAQIKKMNQRAKNTNEALNTLVDLKQKQNNMIDTRTARLQAEQSHLMTVEAGKQSKTLMAFTIVTIVFLPLSFIAAFLAIPTKELGGNTLSLGFVSGITFPLSAVISLFFIVLGFSAPSWRLGRKRDMNIV